MDDLISRQAAIKGKISIQRANGLEIYWDEAVTVSYLERLPAAQPERKTGRWIRHPLYRDANYREWDVCSVCGVGCHRREYGVDLGREYETVYGYNYCPNCGARMEVEG